MMRENGGELMTDEDDWLLFPFLDKSDIKRICRTCNYIVLETENARQWDSFLRNGIAIATNGCGENLVSRNW